MKSIASYLQSVSLYRGNYAKPISKWNGLQVTDTGIYFSSEATQQPIYKFQVKSCCSFSLGALGCA